jgi:hypothetical protein
VKYLTIPLMVAFTMRACRRIVEKSQYGNGGSPWGVQARCFQVVARVVRTLSGAIHRFGASRLWHRCACLPLPFCWLCLLALLPLLPLCCPSALLLPLLPLDRYTYSPGPLRHFTSRLRSQVDRDRLSSSLCLLRCLGGHPQYSAYVIRALGLSLWSEA